METNKKRSKKRKKSQLLKDNKKKIIKVFRGHTREVKSQKKGIEVIKTKCSYCTVRDKYPYEIRFGDCTVQH